MPRSAADNPPAVDRRHRRVRDAIAVDRTGDVPLGVQLAWALRTRIAAGELEAGARLPGLRELAETSGLNVNTVRSVYQRLEHEGLIDTQQGSGTFVAAHAPRSSPAAAIAARAGRAALQTGVDPRDVAAALYVATRTGEQPDPSVERRAALREQIAALERTIGEMEAEYPGLAPQHAGGGTSASPSLPSTADLERIRAQLVRHLTALQALIDESAKEDTREDPKKTLERNTGKKSLQRNTGKKPAPTRKAKVAKTPRKLPAQEQAPRSGPRPAAAGA
jgi:DNA-binding transcriptional regulator YhcF (GntR family)